MSARRSFDARVRDALADPHLKIAIERTTGNARTKRAAAILSWPSYPAVRDLARDIKDHVIANLDHYLVQFERNALASGAQVHWARTGQEACDIVVDICRKAGVRSATRAKSMLGEEIGLTRQDVKIIAQTRGWLRYRLPRRYVRPDSSPVCIGQKQKWFLLKMLSADERVQLNSQQPPEFDGWRWVSYWYPLNQVVAFKREVYRKALKELAPRLPG